MLDLQTSSIVFLCVVDDVTAIVEEMVVSCDVMEGHGRSCSGDMPSVAVLSADVESGTLSTRNFVSAR
jgi:hypothetical protein